MQNNDISGKQIQYLFLNRLNTLLTCPGVKRVTNITVRNDQTCIFAILMMYFHMVKGTLGENKSHIKILFTNQVNNVHLITVIYKHKDYLTEFS